ncbi:MAG: ParB/RepB/Spo0J family partition protein [Alphaproteobacteria bacterium]|jgi:ParB family chromosome partitioning protein|nr:ParB/RepB/Spo0J family partition protein [Alphaproteobacteria bacterium]
MNEIETDTRRAPLGRGLSALLGESALMDDGSPSSVSTLPTLNLKPGKYQPRTRFDDEKLTALIDSIREKGIIQPLVVRPLDHDMGTYEIIAGERRWRAARTLNLENVPVIVREYNDQEALEVALIENIQRDDLTPIEEAEGYHRLLEEFSYTQEELARSIGKSRSHVANMLRLNQLPAHIKEMIQNGKISAGHARTLINAENMEEMAQNIIDNNLNVRQAEQLRRRVRNPRVLEIPDTELAEQTRIIENEIAHLLRLQVALKVKQSGATLTVQFNSYEEIDEFMDKLRAIAI